MALNRPYGPLACGRDLDTLVLRGEPDAHQRDCPHCRRAAAGLRPVQRAADLMRAEPAAPPAGFVEAVMSRVRAQPRRRRAVPLPAAPPSRLSISEHAFHALLATATGAVREVRVLRCRFPDPADPAHVALGVSLRFAASASAIADRIRATVGAAARDQLGLELRTIDVDVEDVHPAS